MLCQLSASFDWKLKAAAPAGSRLWHWGEVWSTLMLPISMYSYDAHQLEIAMLSRSLPKLVHTLERLRSLWSYGYGRSFAIGPRNHPVSTKDSCTKNIVSLQRFLFSIWFQLLCWYSNKSEIPLLSFWVGLVVLVLSFVPPLVLLCLFVCLLGQFFRCLELFVHAGCFFVFWGVSFSLFSCLHLSAS